MNAKLTKVVAMASLAAFLTVGIGANVAQAKDYHFQIGENHRMVKNDDGTVDSSAHPWFKPDQRNIENIKFLNVKNMIKMPLLNAVNNINVPNLQTANHSPFITGYPVI